MTLAAKDTNRPTLSDFIVLDHRDPSTVRAEILARTSDTGGDADDVSDQIRQCLEFIDRMGWRRPADPTRYVDAKSGVRQVERPALDALLALTVSGGVDVIVAIKPARVDRDKLRRGYAITTARLYGVEFRFSQFPPDGRLPDGMEVDLRGLADDLFDRREADEIRARLTPGREARLRDGKPHGGCNGPNYGYREGERERGRRKGRPKGVLNWEVDEERARWVRFLYDTVDSTDIAHLSQRALVRTLFAHGVPSPTGTPVWTTAQVRAILSNSKYAGTGRSWQSRTDWTWKRDEGTRRVFQRRQVVARDAAESFPITTDTIPAIISAEQYARVQQKLAEAAALYPAGAVRRTRTAAAGDAGAPDTTPLLKGFARCAEPGCGRALVRWWDHMRHHAFYQCRPTATRPGGAHAPHVIRADRLQDVVLHVIAEAVTNPETLATLADAAAGQQADAQVEQRLADAAMSAYQTHLHALDAAERDLEAAHAALARVPGMEQQVAEIRSKLAALAQERLEVEDERRGAVPRREEARAREQLLAGLREARLLVRVEHDGREINLAAVTRSDLLIERGQKTPGLQPGDEWPSRLADFVAVGQNREIWNRSPSTRRSSTNSSPLLSRKGRWSLSCGGVGNSIMPRWRSAGTPGACAESASP